MGLTDDPAEKRVILSKYTREFERNVLDQAYELFELEEHCSDAELKEAYRVALLKYHPDKGGDKVIFQAVFPPTP